MWCDQRSTGKSALLLLFGIIAIATGASSVARTKNTSGRRTIEDDSDEDTNCTRLTGHPKRNSSETWSNLEDLLNIGSELIQSYPDVEEGVLILGNTGSGKTTLTHILTGDLSRLFGVRTQSGALVVLDDAEKIGAPSTLSKTIFPDLILLPNNSHHGFYDCPGFDDTRGVDQDIATNFFMSQIVKKVARIKMLFLVNHASVKMGYDRLDFDLLAQHTSRFVRNIGNYKASIGLVVMKVSSYSAGSGKFIKDKSITKEIIEFLSTFNQTLHSKLASERDVSERILISRKIEFVDALLGKDENGRYSRISFSRSVEKCGALSASPVIAQNKERITFLYKNLTASPVDPADFGFTLKDKTSLSISKFMESNNIAISKSVEFLVKYLQMWLDKGNVELQLDSLSSFKTLQSDYLFIEQLTNQTTDTILRGNNSLEPLELGEILVSNLRSFGFYVPLNFQWFLRRQQAYFDFFDEVVGSKFVRTWTTWLLPIHRLQSDISHLHDWFEFCSELDIFLRSYDFQLGKSTYPPRGEATWLDFIETNKIFVVSKRIRSVAASIDSNHFQVLSSILEFALASPQCSCRGKTLTISGNSILFTEFINSVNKTLARTCSEEIKKLVVHAAHSVYIDSDLEVIGKELNVVLIAPIWQVIGSRKFNLSGENGGEIEPRQAADGVSVAADSKQSGGNGVDGSAGKPGGAGGSFYGIARIIERGDFFEIAVNGGNGGPGQHGGNGGNGAKGGGSEKFKYLLVPEGVNHALYPLIYGAKIFPSFLGFAGGNGGGGGIGGMGGLPGKVNIVSLDIPFSVRISKNAGNVGEPGDGGSPGIGGDTGDVRVSRYCLSTLESTCLQKGNVKLITQMRINGTKGIANSSSVGLESPQPPHYIIKEARHVLNFTYAFFTIKQKERVNLSQLMEGSPHIQKHFTPKAFTEEMILLENISLRNGVTVDELVYSYKSCIRRMEGYVESNSAKITVAEKRVFALLFTSGFSKLASFEQSHDLGMIIDIASFFQHLKGQLEQLNLVRASVAVAESRSEYNSNLMGKVEQVREFISEVVKPALNKAENEIAPRLAALGKQFEGLLANSEYELERSKALLKNERELIVLKQILGVIQLASQVLGFLDPTGTVRMIGLGASLTQNLLTNHNSGGGEGRGANMTSTIGHVKVMYDEASKMKQLLTPSAQSGNGSRRSEALISLGTGVADLYDKYKNDKAKLTNLEALVKESELIVADVKLRKLAIETRFIPVVDSIMSYFSNVQTHLESKTRQPLAASELDISKWQFGKALQEIKENLQMLASGINTTEFVKCVDTLLDAFTMMINLYSKMEEYQDAKVLSDYLAELNSASPKSTQTSNPELSAVISKLEKLTRENILRREYRRGIHALKQWVFPFAKLHLTQFEDTIDLGDNDLSQVYLSQIDKLQSQLERYKATTLSSKDSHVIETNFNSSYVSSRPFFVWENEKFGDAIGELLSGAKVYFYADVRLSLEGWDAVKSSKIETNLKLSEESFTPELEKELEDKLKHFSVSMTHSGISSYRFQNKICVMTGVNQTIVYNFERDLNGNRLGRNQIYSKFAKGDFLLSPYTLWTIQLGNAVPKRNVKGRGGHTKADFGRLGKFAKLVDVELVGAGVYVDASAKLNMDLELERYYECDDGLWDLDFYL